MQKRHISPLETPRLRLRLLEERDLPLTLSWRNRDDVRRWFFFSERIAPEQHAAWFTRYRERDDDFVFVIEENSRYTPCAVARALARDSRTVDQSRTKVHATSLIAHTECAGYVPVGQAAIYNIDWLAGTAEFGRLMIGEPEAAGRGLAQEATATLVKMAFEQFGLREVHLEVIPGNERAIRVYDGCGFVFTEGTENAVRMIKRADRVQERAA